VPTHCVGRPSDVCVCVCGCVCWCVGASAGARAGLGLLMLMLVLMLMLGLGLGLVQDTDAVRGGGGSWRSLLSTLSSALTFHTLLTTICAQVAVIPDSGERTLLIAAYFGSIITLFYGWWWIFTCLAIERTELQKKINGEGHRNDGDANGGGGGGAAAVNGAYDSDDDDSDRPDREPEAPRVRLTSIDLNGSDVGGDDEEVVFDAGDGVTPVSPEGGGVHNGSGGGGVGSASASATNSSLPTQRRRKRRTRAERARARAGQLGENLISNGGGNDDDEGSAAWGGNNESPSVDHSAMPDRAKLRMLTQCVRHRCLAHLHHLLIACLSLIITAHHCRQRAPPPRTHTHTVLAITIVAQCEMPLRCCVLCSV
jgi:hypothetical protein